MRAALPWLAAALVIGLWSASQAWPQFGYGDRVGRSCVDFVVEMVAILPAMFVLIGLFEVWVPRAVIERHLGRQAGLKAVPWVVLLATLQAGPLYVAFPVAVSLARKGCSARNVFLYLGAFSSLKVPMLMFEVGFLGWEFSLARVLLSLPAFYGVAVILDRLVPGWTPPFRDVAEPDGRGA